MDYSIDIDKFYLLKFDLYETTINAQSVENVESCKFIADPFDPRVKDYYQKLPPLECKSIQVQQTTLINGTLKLLNPISSCRYRHFGHNSRVDDNSIKYNEWLPLNLSPIKLEKDFVDVSCVNEKGNETYRYQWATVSPKNVSFETKEPFKDENEDHLSVIMLGFDSMSKSNFIRQMPKSFKKLENLGFITFEKHVKVGENTYPNLLSTFLGEHVLEGDDEFNATLFYKTFTSFDNWTNLPFHTFAREGYATLFAEDKPEWALFNFNLRGFVIRPPADHYLRTWYVALNQYPLKSKSVGFCYDDFPLHKLQFNYVESFINGYNGKRKFIFQWLTNVYHDYLNTPQYVDDDFVQHLSNIESSFNKSIVIVFSDHGQRMSTFRQTFLGRLESKLPFLSIRIPEWFKEKHPNFAENLEANNKVLTSHFDLHALLEQMRQGNYGSLEPPKLRRGISFFDKIPPNRSCFEAEIPLRYCPCFEEEELSPSNGTEFAELILEKIHENFKKNKVFDRCVWMILDSVISLTRSIPPSHHFSKVETNTSKIFHYRIQFSVKPPSNAIFEGVVVENEDNGSLTVLNDIERNNRYGNSSYCVDSPVLKKLCHCA